MLFALSIYLQISGKFLADGIRPYRESLALCSASLQDADFWIREMRDSASQVLK